MVDKVFITVTIPTCNRSELLTKLLQSILEQTLNQAYFEIIVIDNGSTDGTRHITEQYETKIKNLLYIYEDRPGLHVGRHVGLKLAKADILVFADDDIQAFPTWLEGIAESFTDSSTVLVGGNNLPEYQTDPPSWINELWSPTPWGKVLGYFSLINFGNEQKQVDPNYVWGCNFAIKKSVLLEVGGFHPDSMPENLLRFRGDGESAVTQAIAKKGYKAIFNPKASVYHYVPASRITLEYIYKRAYTQGISDSYTNIRANRNNFKKSIGVGVIAGNAKSCVKRLLKNVTGQVLAWEEAARLGHRDGYRFHQKEVAKDPNLLKWVLKDHYMDLDGELW